MEANAERRVCLWVITPMVLLMLYAGFTAHRTDVPLPPRDETSVPPVPAHPRPDLRIPFA